MPTSSIDTADEVGLAPVKQDGTLRGFATIWAVRVGDDVFVRAAYGPSTGWYRVARASGRGRLRVGGEEYDVAIADADADFNDAIDAAYRSKYGRRYASIVDGITNEQARACTLRITP